MYIQGIKTTDPLRSIVRSKCTAKGAAQLKPTFHTIDTGASAQKARPKVFSVARETEKPRARGKGTAVFPSAERPEKMPTVPIAAREDCEPRRPDESCPAALAEQDEKKEAVSACQSDAKTEETAQTKTAAVEPPARTRIEVPPPQEKAVEKAHPDCAGLLSYQKWWFLNDVDIRVGGALLSGVPISLNDDTLRVINDTYSYFIPLRQIEFIRTPDGLANLDALWQRKHMFD